MAADTVKTASESLTALDIETWPIGVIESGENGVSYATA